MLKKILKYDLQYIYKVLVVFYILSILFALFTRAFWLFTNSTIFNILGYVASGCTISFIFSILINNIMRAWARFVKNTYGDESYLTHTLPVSKQTLYLSKFLSSIITMFTSVLVILLTVFIAYYSKDNLEALRSSLNMLATVYDSSIIKILMVILFVFFLEMSMLIQTGYTGIILGHKSNNNKMVKSIIYGILIYLATQVLTLLIIFAAGIFNNDIMQLFISNQVVNISVVKFVMYLGLLIYIIYLIVYYIVDIKLFQKGVNVD